MKNLVVEVFPREGSTRGSGKKVGVSRECVECSLFPIYPEQRSKGPRVPEGIPEPGNDLLIAGVTCGCYINS